MSANYGLSLGRQGFPERAVISLVPGVGSRHAEWVSYRRRRKGEGWHTCAPGTVAMARPSDNLEVFIRKVLRGSGFELTIVDLALQRGETSLHETVEDAKKHAETVMKRRLEW